MPYHPWYTCLRLLLPVDGMIPYMYKKYLIVPPNKNHPDFIGDEEGPFNPALQLMSPQSGIKGVARKNNLLDAEKLPDITRQLLKRPQEPRRVREFHFLFRRNLLSASSTEEAIIDFPFRCSVSAPLVSARM
mgnify:CR=1 FL=1